MSKAMALRIIRRDEQMALGHLSGQPTNHAYTAISVAREFYMAVEKPPTRHHSFTIHTLWDMPARRAISHNVGASYPGWGLRQVVADRPGLFGSGDVQEEIHATTQDA